MKKIIKSLGLFSFWNLASSKVWAAEKTRISRIINESIVENITWSSVSKVICWIAVAIILISSVGYIIASAHKKQEIKKAVGASLIISVLVLETSVVSNMIRSAKYELGQLQDAISPATTIESITDIEVNNTDSKILTSGEIQNSK